MPMKLRSRVSWLLDYEPTWFPEVASGFAILGWSLAAFVTRDYTIEGGAWLMPVAGLLIGPARWLLTVRLPRGPRVAAAAVGAVFWGWILIATAQRWGVVPMMGPTSGMLLLDMLTLGRFSMPGVRDLVAELRARRAAR